MKYEIYLKEPLFIAVGQSTVGLKRMTCDVKEWANKEQMEDFLAYRPTYLHETDENLLVPNSNVIGYKIL